MDEPVSKDKSLESWIWDGACSIRGAKDALKYKDYILPLIFTKRLCDVPRDGIDRIQSSAGFVIGKPIQMEVLQHERAEYRGQIIATLSQELSAEFGRGYNYSALN